MRLLTTLSSTHWLCTAETVSPIIEKTTSLGKDIILALKTHMRILGLIYHMHHWTWNWQSQTNLVGAAPFRVLHCGPPPLGPILPIPSVCSESSPSSQNCIRYENPCCCEKNMVVFSFTQTMEIGWKGRRCKSLPIYGKQCIFPSEMVSFPKNNACPKLNSHKYHAIFCEAVTLSNPPSQMGKHKKICILGPPHLSLEDAFSSNWTEVIKCGSQIDSAYQQKAYLNEMIDTNPGQRHYFFYSPNK